jgi:3-dehydrosphinganine reductase
VRLFSLSPFLLRSLPSRKLSQCAGLAEALRSELLLYSISVHLFLPATIFTPGFEAEMRSKPDITKRIEGPDEGMKPDEVARELIKGTLCFSTSCLVALVGFDDISPRLTVLRFSFSHCSREGLERNDFYITYEPVGHMLRTSRGITPRNNFLLDQFWGIIGSVRSFLSSIPERDGS